MKLRTELEKKRLHAVVTGRVQGVGFRYFVQQKAAKLDITGWVSNRWDGSVELIAEGSHLSLQALLKNLYRGPSSAIVKDVDFAWQTATGEFRSFRVKFS